MYVHKEMRKICPTNQKTFPLEESLIIASEDSGGQKKRKGHFLPSQQNLLR
jgi:hypothetical protein